jgi:hypothetical protein
MKEELFRYLVLRISLLLVLFLIGANMAMARRWRIPSVRSIPGLKAIPFLIGRAVEMGRPMLFSFGLSSVRDVEFLASLPVFRAVMEKSAQLGGRVIVPVCVEDTIPAIRTTYREASLSAGRPEIYNPDEIRFFPGGQFYYAIATMSYMMEQLPASCIYFGSWAAESLMIAETGRALNAAQIAATPSLFQIPFFIATCDYVIIGEEFYAASASMGEDRVMLRSIRGQDLIKLVLIAAIIIGSIAISIPGTPFESAVMWITRAIGG